MGMGSWPGPDDDGDGCTFAGRSSDREVKTYIRIGRTNVVGVYRRQRT
jgi:hypothetical protein